jgi:glycosyltransferase involved in cell wall biosynthesis
MTMPETDATKGARHIGFVSTRLAGTDGVSLETAKWAEVLARMKYTCFYFAGVSDRPPERTRLVPEAFFGHEVIDAISKGAFEDEDPTGEYWTAFEAGSPKLGDIYRISVSRRFRPPAMTDRIHALRDQLKRELRSFVQTFDIDLLIVENALTIPMNIPFGLAITEFIAETGFPAIAHHHDFYWERQRFLVNCVWDYLRMAFPPNLPSIRHVVISSLAAHQLALRTGISPMVIPNVMDFERPPPAPDAYAADVREALGLSDGELLLLQPTRVVQRKGIEHAIELTKRVGLAAKLVISHASGDEGSAYERRVREYAEMLKVPVKFEAEIISEARGTTADGRKVYTLADVYPSADLVTYPSTAEGFGNAFLEAVYYRRPLVVNNYSIFDVDIKPKGFRVVEFDGYVTDDTVEQTRQVLTNPTLALEMTAVNYRLASQHFSYGVLQRRLRTLIAECFGEQDVLERSN